MSEEFSLTLLLITTLILTVVFYFINKSNGKKKLVQQFSILLILLIIWNIGLILQLAFSERLGISPIYFDYITYIGIVFLPVALFFFTKTFINPKFKIKKKYCVLFIIPIISLAMLYTNDFHHLFYIHYSTVLNEIEYGPFMYLHLIYTYALLAVDLVLLLKHSIKVKGMFSTQSFLLLLAILVPLLINLLGFLNIFNGMDIYITPISFAISLLLIAISIFKYDFLNITTIAMDLITDTLSDCYLILNNDDAIVNFNKTFLKTFKLHENDLLNKNITSISKSNSDLDNIKIAIGLIKENKKTITINKYFNEIDRYFTIDISPIVKPQNQNQIVGTLIFFKDITELEKDKIQIKSNQDLLIEQERLASLGQMIGGIAHNLKTPIFSVSGGLEGLSDLVKEFDESIDDPEVTSKDMHDIAKDMNDWIVKLKDHMSYMSDVITTVKGQTVAMSEAQNTHFTIKELFDQVMILMQHELKEKLTKLNITNETPYNVTIYGNISSLIQVINNLISNAIEAYMSTDKEKIINLSATYNNTNKYIYITIQDFGPGLPKSVQDKVFKEMVTTKGKYGTGLRTIYVIFKYKSTF